MHDNSDKVNDQFKNSEKALKLLTKIPFYIKFLETAIVNIDDRIFNYFFIKYCVLIFNAIGIIIAVNTLHYSKALLGGILFGCAMIVLLANCVADVVGNTSVTANDIKKNIDMLRKYKIDLVDIAKEGKNETRKIEAISSFMLKSFKEAGYYNKVSTNDLIETFMHCQ